MDDTPPGRDSCHQALSAGAVAYLLKNTMSPELVGVIRDLHQGRRPIMSPELRSRLEERVGEGDRTAAIRTAVARGTIRLA